MMQLFTVLLFGSLSLSAHAAGKNPIFDTCGEYRVTGTLDCPSTAASKKQCRMIVAPKSNSETILELSRPLPGAELYSSHRVTGTIILNSLSLPLRATLSSSGLKRVLSVDSNQTVQKLKEQSCIL